MGTIFTYRSLPSNDVWLAYERVVAQRSAFHAPEGPLILLHPVGHEGEGLGRRHLYFDAGTVGPSGLRTTWRSFRVDGRAGSGDPVTRCRASRQSVELACVALLSSRRGRVEDYKTRASQAGAAVRLEGWPETVRRCKPPIPITESR